MTLYHVHVKARSILAYSDDLLRDLYRCDYNDVPHIRTRLTMELIKGNELVPLGFYCTNFDPLEGCRGHESEADMVESSACALLRYKRSLGKSGGTP